MMTLGPLGGRHQQRSLQQGHDGERYSAHREIAHDPPHPVFHAAPERTNGFDHGDDGVAATDHGDRDDTLCCRRNHGRRAMTCPSIVPTYSVVSSEPIPPTG